MPAEDVTHSGDIVSTEVPAGNVTDSRDIVSMEIGKSRGLSIKDNSSRYHRTDSSYALPTTKDTTERERLDKLHLMFKLALGSNILAPINSDPKRIIDVGAGSGI